MSDTVVVVVAVLTFAVLITAHLALVLGLALREPRWHAAVAFVVPPLAPYWGFRENMRVRSIVWGAAFVVYVIVRAIG